MSHFGKVYPRPVAVNKKWHYKLNKIDKSYCDIITEERAVTRLGHSEQLISVTIIAYAKKNSDFCGVRADSDVSQQ